MKFLNGGPADLTVTEDGTYQTVDLTSHIPAADQGSVAVAMISTFNDGDENIGGVRAVSSTDTIEYGQGGGFKTRQFWYPKVDANDQVEIKLGNTGAPNWAVRFWGYFTTDEAVGFTNPTDNNFTPGVVDTWTDADISTLTGADTALAAIVVMDAEVIGSVSSAGLRVNGSTDVLRPNFGGENVISHVIGVDGSEIFEANIANGGINIFVAGYIKANFTALTNMVDVTGASTGSYEDIDLSGSIPADNTFMAGLADHGSNSSRTSGLRQNGWTVDEQGSCTRQQGFTMGIDANRVMEHNRSSSAISLWLRGYGAEPAAAGGTTFNESLTFGLGLGDTVAASQQMNESIAEGIGLGDALATNVQFNASLTEGIGLGDTVAAGITYNVSVEFGLGLGDTVGRTQSFDDSVTFGLGLGDAYSAQVTYNESVEFGIGLGDAYADNITQRGWRKVKHAADTVWTKVKRGEGTWTKVENKNEPDPWTKS